MSEPYWWVVFADAEVMYKIMYCSSAAMSSEQHTISLGSIHCVPDDESETITHSHNMYYIKHCNTQYSCS